jgi:hypothetical protein
VKDDERAFMRSFAPQIADCLRWFRHGDTAKAFHGLVEMDDEILPHLMAAFRVETDSRTREFLVNVVWEHRRQSVIPFLGEALFDLEPRVWRQALDGLVTLASPASLDTLRSARTRQFPQRRKTKEFRCWLEEAIGQVETAHDTV